MIAQEIIRFQIFLSIKELGDLMWPVRAGYYGVLF